MENEEYDIKMIIFKVIIIILVLLSLWRNCSTDEFGNRENIYQDSSTW